MGKSLTMNFLDFQKAFDVVHRESMWKIVEKYGVPIRIIKIMKTMYDSSESCVRLNQGQTDFFVVDTELGNVIPYRFVLFNNEVDLAMKRVELAGDGIE